MESHLHVHDECKIVESLRRDSFFFFLVVDIIIIVVIVFDVFLQGKRVSDAMQS